MNERLLQSSFQETKDHVAIKYHIHNDSRNLMFNCLFLIFCTEFTDHCCVNTQPRNLMLFFPRRPFRERPHQAVLREPPPRQPGLRRDPARLLRPHEAVQGLGLQGSGQVPGLGGRRGQRHLQGIQPQPGEGAVEWLRPQVLSSAHGWPNSYF